MKEKTPLKILLITALGIALYVVMNLLVKIPVIGHISLDLGYIVFAVYCYYYGPAVGMTVGGMGCLLASLVGSGWFAPGWMAGNLIIGFIMGILDKESGAPVIMRLFVVVVSTALGIVVVKTVIESLLYSIPLWVKLPKNAVAFMLDAITMGIGTYIAPKVPLDKLK